MSCLSLSPGLTSLNWSGKTISLQQTNSNVLPLSLSPGLTSLHWSGGLPDEQPVYACAGGSLLLPWNVSESASESLDDIQWFYRGGSEEMVAVLAHGNFLLMPAFSGRVQHVATGGLFLSHVQVADSGNYSIRVSGHDGGGAFFTLSHTARVRVGGQSPLIFFLSFCVPP